MSPLIGLLVGLLYLVVLALEVVILFIGAHILALGWPHPWWVALDRVGAPLVQQCRACCQQVAKRLGRRPLSEKQQMVAALLTALALHLLLTGMGQLLCRW
jgi:hypothetical protein